MKSEETNSNANVDVVVENIDFEEIFDVELMTVRTEYKTTSSFKGSFSKR